MLRSHGVEKVTTFDAISVNTRRRLQEARQKSHGSLPHTPPLPIRSLSSSRSDSRLPQVPSGQESGGIIRETHEEETSGRQFNNDSISNTSNDSQQNDYQASNNSPNNSQDDNSSLINNVNYASPNLSNRESGQVYNNNNLRETKSQFEEVDKEREIRGSYKSHRRHTEGVLSGLSKSNEVEKSSPSLSFKSRNRFHSTGGFLQPEAPSSRPSSAARKMAKKPPKKETVKETEERDGAGEKEEEKGGVKSRPEDVAITNTDSPQQPSLDVS